MLLTLLDVGTAYAQKGEYDNQRTARLNELGYEVVRFTNEEVYSNPESVVSRIKEILTKL